MVDGNTIEELDKNLRISFLSVKKDILKLKQTVALLEQELKKTAGKSKLPRVSDELLQNAQEEARVAGKKAIAAVKSIEKIESMISELDERIEHLESSKSGEDEIFSRISQNETEINKSLKRANGLFEEIESIKEDTISNEDLRKQLDSEFTKQEKQFSKKTESLYKEIQVIAKQVKNIQESLSSDTVSEDQIKKEIFQDISQMVEEGKQDTKALRKDIEQNFSQIERNVVRKDQLVKLTDQINSRCDDIDYRISDIVKIRKDVLQVEKVFDRMNLVESQISEVKRDFSSNIISENEIAHDVSKDIEETLDKNANETKKIAGELENLKEQLSDTAVSRQYFADRTREINERIYAAEDRLNNLSHAMLDAKDKEFLQDEIDDIKSRFIEREELSERFERLAKGLLEIKEIVSQYPAEKTEVANKVYYEASRFKEEAADVEEPLPRKKSNAGIANWLKDIFGEEEKEPEEESAYKDKFDYEEEKRKEEEDEWKTKPISKGWFSKTISKASAFFTEEPISEQESDEQIIKEKQEEIDNDLREKAQRKKKSKGKGFFSLAAEKISDFFAEDLEESESNNGKKAISVKESPRKKKRKGKPSISAGFLIVIAILAVLLVAFVALNWEVIFGQKNDTLSFIFFKNTPSNNTQKEIINALPQANESDLENYSVSPSVPKEPVGTVSSSNATASNISNASSNNLEAVQKYSAPKSETSGIFGMPKRTVALLSYFIFLAIIIGIIIFLYATQKDFRGQLIGFFTRDKNVKALKTPKAERSPIFYVVIFIVILLGVFTVYYAYNTPLNESVIKSDNETGMNASEFQNPIPSVKDNETAPSVIISKINLSIVNETRNESKNKECILANECQQTEDGQYFFDCYYDEKVDSCRCFKGAEENCQVAKVSQIKEQGTAISGIGKFFVMYQYYFLAGILMLILVVVIASEQMRRRKSDKIKAKK